MTDLASFAADRGIRYFLFSFADLFGVQRAKLVPASAVADLAANGAGFAGFAAWLAMTPADPDVLAHPDPASLMVLPWQPEVAWVATDLSVEGVPLAPQRVSPGREVAPSRRGTGAPPGARAGVPVREVPPREAREQGASPAGAREWEVQARVAQARRALEPGVRLGISPLG